MEENIVIGFLPHLKTLCWFVIISGTAYILYKRHQKKLVTFKEIENWVKSNKGNGTHAVLHKVSVLPHDIKKSVKREVGLKKVINGYKDDASIHVTILDEDNKVIKRMFFFGNILDNELIEGFGENVGIDIKLV